MIKIFLPILWLVLLSAAAGFAQELIRIDGFDNEFSSWKLTEFRGRADYSVRTAPRPRITLSTTASNYILSRELKDFDLPGYPILVFEWQVERHPAGGDLRKRSTDDQAAGLYLTLPSFPEKINFKSIGYVWDNAAPPGVYSSPSSGNIKYLVLRSGSGGLNEWHRERRNIVEDFKSVWGLTIDERRKVVLSLAADSDGTGSSSRASFGTIAFMKR